MVAPNFISGLEQITLASPKKARSKDLKKEFEDNQIVEEYEGDCEDCDREVTRNVCPMCEG